jgi:raffinose/stachyose/melibiose transport system permease protein
MACCSRADLRLALFQPDALDPVRLHSFIGLGNFAQFLREPFLIQGLINTVIFAVVTSGAKVVLGLLLAVLLTSDIAVRDFLRSVVFFPVLVSTIGVGITFTVLMHPTRGMINAALALVGVDGPGWLTDPRLAIYSVAMVDIWKGVGLATVIFIAGIVAIPRDYYEAARIDGSSKWQSFWYITLPLSRPAMVTVITLSFIGGLRTFDLIWAMTRGGPGFCLRHDRLHHLQTISVGLLRPVHCRQCGPLHPHRGAGDPVDELSQSPGGT